VCIAIPALVRSVDGREAVAEVGDRLRQINVFLTPEVKVGDYVLLRNGYATMIYSEQEALEILELLEEISKMDSN